MLRVKVVRFALLFFSGWNSCVPSVASELRSSGKFPILLKPNLEIRLNIEEFERRIRLDIQFNKSAKIGGNSLCQQTPSERADVSALIADIRRRQRALLTGNVRPCRERA